MPEETLIYEESNAAGWITLNRPDFLNAINLQMIEELSAALTAAETNPELRALVITGRGRAFCAGADLNMAASAEYRLRFRDGLLALLDRLERSPLPVIAAVNGLAVAGGFELLLACDLVLSAESARIGDGHGKYGLIPAGGSTARLPRRVGMNRAKLLLFSAELLPAAELVDYGLVLRVTSDEGLINGVEEVLRLLQDRSPLVTARMKQLLNRGVDLSLAEAIQHEYEMVDLHDGSNDKAEGLAAFNAKRAAKFSGT